MRIVAIDASPHRGTVSRSVEAAAHAAEQAGAQVHRVRLYDLDVVGCTDCLFCEATGECRIADDVPPLAALIKGADGVILGTPSYFWHANEPTRALVERLTRYFGAERKRDRAGAPREPRRTSDLRRATKRAVIITACAIPEPLATFFGYSTGPVRELRRALGTGGIRTVGSLAVTDLWLRPSTADLEQDRAASLGRILAGKI